jgi:DNA-binding response OmpR family regulator
MMPSMDGTPLPPDQGRQALRHIPVILVTARSGADADEGIEAGADDYLAKPFDSRAQGPRPFAPPMRKAEADLALINQT